MTNNFINIGLPTDSGGFWELQRAHEAFMYQPHYTMYELNLAQSGFLDARNNILNTELSQHQQYEIIHELYNKLTDTQKIILDLYLCSGLSQAEITTIQNYTGSRSVLFHLEAISKKLHKFFKPQEIGLSSHSEQRIADPYTGRYEGESTAEWFNRVNGE